MKILIAGGGTGGHVFPGVAVAREMKRKNPDTEIIFVGTSEGIESRIIPKEGFELRFIRSEGLVGRGFFRSLMSAIKIPLSMKDSFRILKELRPDVVLGVGGYCSGPVVLCAHLMGIPTIIHEQNTVPGLTNKILGKFSDVIAVTYFESIDYFQKDKTFLTGSPIRNDIFTGSRERGYKTFGLDRGLFTILVFGGSLGAGNINRAMSEALVYLEEFKDNIQFLHQTGQKDLPWVKEFYNARGFRGTVIPFIHEMGDAYAVADIAVTRAGASTLAELTACGKAAILVPYPFAAGDHQEFNARKLWDLGAAQMIIDRQLNGKTLGDLIKYLFQDPEAIGQMERNSLTLGKPDAAGKILELIEGLVKNQKSKIKMQN